MNNDITDLEAIFVDYIKHHPEINAPPECLSPDTSALDLEALFPEEARIIEQREKERAANRIKVKPPAWREQLMKRRNKYYIRRK